MLTLSTKKKRREIWGIIYLCLLAFVVVSLLSFDPRDPSLNSVSSSKEVQNLAGLAGSYTADILFQTFGLSAYLLLLPLMFLMIQAFFPTEISRRRLRMFGFSLMILFSAGLASLALETIAIHDQKLLAGGLIGHLATTALLPLFNRVGSYIIILGGLVITIIVSLNVSLATTFEFVVSLFSKFFSIFGVFKLLRRRNKQPAGIEILSDEEEEEGVIDIEAIDASDSPYIEENPAEMVEVEAAEPSYPETEVYAEDIPPEPEYEAIDDIPTLEEEDPPSPDPVIVTPSEVEPRKRKKKFQKLSADFLKPKGTFKIPSIDVLSSSNEPLIQIDREIIIRNSRILEQKLKNFNVHGHVVEVRPGPVITVYEFEPAPGIKVSKIVNLSDDLALALSALSVRIVAPIPGKSVVGIELPNENRNIVTLRGILENNEFKSLKYRLPIALGKSISGEPLIGDLSRMPHLLVAGATGAGKSVFLNSIICSLLFRYTPDDLRLLLIDPKMLELSMYEDIPHLLLPVVTDPKKAAMALKWAVQEMDRRYTLMSKVFVRNIDRFNKKVEDSPREELERLIRGEGENHDDEDFKVDKLPYIVIVIDELSDLMIVASKEVELSIARLAQMARAAGIHLMVATQRPSVDVLTGLIKANFSTRVAFQVASKVDSRTILDAMGAEKLLGNGDMLYSPPGTSKIQRVHGAYVSDTEVKDLCELLKTQGEPQYETSILSKQIEDAEISDFDEDEDLYQEAISLISKCRYASISMVQRRLRIGYNRAARIIEQMETEGIVGPADGAKPREVLLKNPE